MSDTVIKRSPDDFDWPATIFLYVVLIALGIGMCFCLRQANRLIPNRFSFPLVDRGEGRQRGLYDLGVEEEGLLNHYSDVEDEDDAEVIDNQNALRNNQHSDFEDEEEEEEEEEFGTLQQHQKSSSSSSSSSIQQKATVFDIEQVDEEDELYMNPYKDDHLDVK